ncbi:hypothetical protein E4K10_14690 [Streptomyces sp. T1317-0309]|nr:hypothetical protein E4K10_14690 [Streptomyces sp. T1317-0309]
MYAYGGFPGGGAPDDLHRAAETYVPTANVWATLPLMPTAREDLAGAAALSEGRDADVRVRGRRY